MSMSISYICLSYFMIPCQAKSHTFFIGVLCIHHPLRILETRLQRFVFALQMDLPLACSFSTAMAWTSSSPRITLSSKSLEGCLICISLGGPHQLMFWNSTPDSLGDLGCLRTGLLASISAGEPPPRLSSRQLLSRYAEQGS